MKISKLVSGIPGSATLALTARVKELTAQGRDIIGFGAGEPEYYPVVFGICAEGYYLDEENAKNLLKNLAIEDAYTADLKSILESLKPK